MSATPPTTLGKYQIIREIARSNDIVYEAYDPLMDRRVAVKELNIPNGSTPQQVQDRVDRFEREARAAGRLSHPNTMTVYDVAQEGNRYYMAMEYLDGHTLRNEVDTRGALPTDEALKIAKEVLRGLSHAHKEGVVHRDIKPDNIQILSSGQIKITDFGIARLTFQPNITMDGQVFGTPSYMSPEQVRGGEIDARSDIFSLGIVLYEMVAGQKPFQGDNVISITHAIMNYEPTQPSQANYALWGVIQRALDKSPSLRFKDADEMIRAIERVEEGDTVVNPYQAQMPQFQLPIPTQSIPTYNPYNPYPTQTHQTQGPVYDPNVPPNPYGQSSGNSNQPQQPVYLPYPIYAPPKIIKPLLTPAQSAGLKKFISVTVIIGTFLALIVAMLNVFIPKGNF